MAEQVEDALPELNLGLLDLTSDDFILDEVSVHIQENLEDELVKEALESGMDLRNYSKNIEMELQVVENASVKDYIKESKSIASLHKQITNCDLVLERMEQMLNTFQSDLGSISSEIQILQDQSISMNIKLKNRQSIRGELSQFVDEMAIHEPMMNNILEIAVTEREFLESLHELNHKIQFVKEQSFNDALACKDVQDALEKLKFKAVAKIREFILQKIYQFRKPLTNYQVPQNALLKFRFYYEFLLANSRNVAQEIQDEYVDTMSKIYFSYFKGYTNKLLKLQYEEVASKDDLIGVEDITKRGFFSKPTLRNKSTIFTLGNRADILTNDLESPIIVPHASQKMDSKYTFESIFRSQHFALLDNCCREYLFLIDFFVVSGNTAQELFNAVFGKSFSMLMKHMDMYVSECFDSIAIFLCIHIILRYQVIMHKRKVPALSKYWETLLDIMWPRFQYILGLNIQSIHDIDPQKLGAFDIRPHYITRRYAEFSAALVSLNETFPNEKVNRLLAHLQLEVENYILKLAAEFPGRKDQLIFLINNYDMMLSVIMERTTDDCKESFSFQLQLRERSDEFIEEILAHHFGEIILFVKDVELKLERNNEDLLKTDERIVGQLVKNFSSSWKQAVDLIYQDIMKSFTNFKNGTIILQKALTQLLHYHLRFQKILSQPPFKSMPFQNDLISRHHVMIELKKYKLNF